MQATINGFALHYAIDGLADDKAPWITLSHSLAADSAMWAPQLPALRSKFRILRIDTRGHGGSAAPAGPYTLEQLAEDVLALWDHLGVQCSHWLGLSLGGMIGQVLALKAPDRVQSLILADTTGRGAPNAAAMWGDRATTAREKGMAALVEGTLSRWFTEPYHAAAPEVIARFGETIRSTTVAGYAGCCAAISQIDTLDALRSLQIPALILVGAQDQATSPQMAQALHANLAGSRLCIIDHAAHIANVEQPAAFNEAMLEFLASMQKH